MKLRMTPSPTPEQLPGQRLWVAQGDCGDYYCDGEHLLGVFTTPEGAQAAADRYSAMAFNGVGRGWTAKIAAYTLDEQDEWMFKP